MISWPAANEIRCVNPSIATVSPSWTSSATASCIVVTLPALVRPALVRPELIGPELVRLELIRRPSVSRPAKDAELVALDVLHDGPERRLAIHGAGRFRDVVDLG